MKIKTKKTLYNFILSELEQLRENVKDNYDANLETRKKNPFLVFKNSNAEKFMGLGRSIDSQLGNRIQNIIYYLSRIRYGKENVPNIVNILCNKSSNKVTLETFYIKGDIKKNNYYANTNPCKQIICINEEINIYEAKRRMRIKKSVNISVKKNQIEYDHVAEYIIDDILTLKPKKIPVDLLIISEKNDGIKTFEIKMSGNLDTKNAESNAREVERLYKLFSFTKDNASYFATCYGECSDAVKTEVSKHLSKNSILNTEDFWDMILPVGDEEISKDDFIELYSKAFIKSGIEKVVLAL